MRRPSFLVVLLVVCTTLRSCVVAVRFRSLEELLKYHEQQQNPGVTENFLVTTAEALTNMLDEVHEQQGIHGMVDEEQPKSKTEGVLVTTVAPLPNVMGDEAGSGLDSMWGLPTSSTMGQVMETELPMTTRRMTTCCLLGEQAGMKRHHCNPDNYMPRSRAHNRGHNFKQSNRHPSMEKSQLSKCTSGIIRRLSEEFRTCCQEAYKRMWTRERGEEDHGNGRIHLIEVPI